MIGLLTSNFSLYYDLVNVLRKRNIPFVSLTFNEEIPPNVGVIITSEEEKDNIMFDKLVACKANCNVENMIDKALLMENCEDAKIIFGIDPGINIGIAIYGNEMLLRRFVAKSPDKAVDFIKSFIKDVCANNIIVRIGDGARLIRNRIINLLRKEKVKIEVVNEASIPCIDDDALAASSIAMTKGIEVKENLSVEPKEGEIKEMQRLSRIKSKNITISKELAKKVLMGEMELEEAIERQKNKNYE
ncbi:MAG: hypothetical protein J7L80_03130 [Thermoplasmata archaeon]|nr:hypothetical protein [Thermoplasmata archaeon]